MNKQWRSIVIGLALLGCIGGGYYYFASFSQNSISDFNDKRDTCDVLALMKDNWYWLISSPDYQADFMLRERAPSHKDPVYFGKLIIKVLRKNNQLVGFTAYYKKTESQGHILFLAIDESFRRGGYASQLFDSAVDDLRKMGAKWVRLVTREGNSRARSLYKKMGMEEYRIDDGFAHYRMLL